MNSVSRWRQRSALDSASVEKRLKTVEKLAQSDDKDAVNLAARALADPAVEIQVAAACALANHHDPRGIAPLVELALSEDANEFGETILHALVTYPPKQVSPLLLDALDSDDANRRLAAAAALTRVGYDHVSDMVRAKIAIVRSEWEHIADFGNAAIPPVCMAMREGTQHVRRLAAECLGNVGTELAFRALVALLEDQTADDTTRKMAAWALRSFCWTWLNDALLAQRALLLEEWDELVALGEAAVPVLAKALANEEKECTAPIVEALRAINTPSAHSALDRWNGRDKPTKSAADTTGHKHPPRRLRPAKKIEMSTRAGKAEPVPAVRKNPFEIDNFEELLESNSWADRQYAARKLRNNASWSPKSNKIRALVAIAEKKWDELVALGSQAVALLVDTLTVQPLDVDVVRTLARLDTQGRMAVRKIVRESTHPMEVREVAAIVLAETGGTSAVEPLTVMLEDADIVIGLCAASALRRIGWVPTRRKHKVLLAIADGDWEALMPLGADTVDQLLKLAKADLALHEAGSILVRVLQEAPNKISADQLKALCVARKPGSDESDAAAIDVPMHGDWAKVRELADAILKKRGAAPKPGDAGGTSPFRKLVRAHTTSAPISTAPKLGIATSLPRIKPSRPPKSEGANISYL